MWARCDCGPVIDSPAILGPRIFSFARTAGAGGAVYRSRSDFLLNKIFAAVSEALAMCLRLKL